MVDLKDSCDMSAVSVVRNLHHSEDSLLKQGVLENCKAVAREIVSILDDVVNGLSDRDLSGGGKLPQRPDGRRNFERQLVTLCE